MSPLSAPTVNHSESRRQRHGAAMISRSMAAIHAALAIGVSHSMRYAQGMHRSAASPSPCAQSIACRSERTRRAIGARCSAPRGLLPAVV